MNAVVNASATAAGASRGPPGPAGAAAPGRGSATHAASRPRTGAPVRGSRMWSPLRTPEALSAVWRIDSRARTRDGSPGSLSVSGQPSQPAGGSSARAELKPAVDERAVEAPVLEQLRHQVHRVALADAAEIDAHAVGRRADQEGIGIDLERRQPGADGDVERAVGQVVQVPRDEEAFERGLADACALSGREVIERG